MADDSRDADLINESFFDRRNRFLCITRAYYLSDNLTPVVEDLKIINERETPPAHYLPLATTVDNFECGTSKRLICVKLAQRQAGMRCISDIIFLYRTRRPPQPYTSVGDINGLQMCIKEGKVPPLRVPFVHQQSSLDHSAIGTMTTTKRNDEKEMLDGIPFEINSKYLQSNRNVVDELTAIERFLPRSINEIEQIYHYDFVLERSLADYC